MYPIKFDKADSFERNLFVGQTCSKGFAPSLRVQPSTHVQVANTRAAGRHRARWDDVKLEFDDSLMN